MELDHAAQIAQPTDIGERLEACAPAAGGLVTEHPSPLLGLSPMHDTTPPSPPELDQDVSSCGRLQTGEHLSATAPRIRPRPRQLPLPTQAVLDAFVRDEREASDDDETILFDELDLDEDPGLQNVAQPGMSPPCDVPLVSIAACVLLNMMAAAP